MSEILQESTVLSGTIDRQAGIIHGVKIIGVKSKNGRTYPGAVLQEALPLYENAKVNLDHPDTVNKARKYSERFGVIKNVVLKEDDGLYADFLFNAKHPAAEQLLWDAEHLPENAGFSHNVEAVIKNGTVEKIVSVRSVDLVADPATTEGLFESAQEYRRETAPSLPLALKQEVLAFIEEQLKAQFSETRCQETLCQETLCQETLCQERREFKSGFDVKNWVRGLK